MSAALELLRVIGGLVLYASFALVLLTAVGALVILVWSGLARLWRSVTIVAGRGRRA